MADYLYNGVRLPDIEGDYVDTSAYNGVYYSVLAQNTASGEYYLFISNQPWKFDGADVFSKCFACNGYGVKNDKGTRVWDGEYSALMATVYLKSIRNCDRCFWTSHDILNEDGTVFLAASNPIPVGGEPLDPTSMLMGWLAGRQIAGMRGK